ncbi:MAG: adenosylcobinamide-GDP ribazoletransferase [Candidatus Omnitrophica bacterium]|nr:adenosylcobinamide-GDP ribazoletransferase [Candidatus Omnitrophota bacterium]
MIKALFLAVQFLTIVPLKIKHADAKDLGLSLLYFPAMGLLLGLVLVFLDHIFVFLGFQPWVIGILLTVSLILATGAIHLDGLADTVDALAGGGGDRERMLQIMRDPHIGVMGVLGLVSVVLLKIAFLVSLDGQTVLKALLMMCLLSRWVMVFLMFIFPYARQEGKAKVYILQRSKTVFISSLIITLLCAVLLMGFKGLLVLVFAAVCAYELGDFINRRLGGITGDTIGGINELSEILVLFFLFIIERSFIW